MNQSCEQWNYFVSIVLKTNNLFIEKVLTYLRSYDYHIYAFSTLKIYFLLFFRQTPSADVL